MTVSILLASRGRPHLLKSVIQQIVDTTDISIELAMATEADPPSLKIMQEISLPERVSRTVSYIPDAVSHPNAAWNRLLAVSKYQIVFIAGDDAIYHPRWLDFALQAHAEHLSGYGMIGLNDGAWKRGELATTPLYDKKFCKEVLGGVCFCPHYHQYWADFENYEKAVASGHYYWCEDARVTHTQGQTMAELPNDESFSHSQKWSVIDGHLLHARRAHGFPNNFEPVI